MRRMPFFALATVSAAALSSTPALGQAPVPVESTPQEVADDNTIPPDADTTNAQGEPTSEGAIVVTGSRLRRDTYNTNSPVDLITRDDIVLSGNSSTAEALQSSTITSGTAQINQSFLGFVSEGGPAANTVGLRGLGAARTLVLLNGRRLAPAGAGPELIAADLNVLPNSAVQRVEILREGASSVYGSDAVAGVINVITDTKLDGLTFDFYTEQPIMHGGGGRTYRASATGGMTFDRGHIMASLEYRQSTGMRLKDRKDMRCPQDLYTSPTTGEQVGQGSPDDPTRLRCFPFQSGAIGTAQNYMLAYSIFQGTTPGGINRFTFGDGDINDLVLVNNNNLRPLASERQLEEHIMSPLKTLTGYANAAYQLTDAIEVYGEALYTRRKSRQDYASQISIDPAQLGYGPYGYDFLYGGNIGGTPISEYADYGFNVTPFFPTELTERGFNIGRVFIVPPIQEAKQKIDFFRTNAGARGDLGFKDWRFDVNAQYSLTKSRYSIEQIDTRDLRNSLTVVEAPDGTPSQYTATALDGQDGAGGTYTCAVNVTGGSYNNGTCVPINIFAPSVLAGDIPDNVFNFLFSPKVGHTTFEQITLNGVVDGTLFELPAGKVQAAVGFEHRRDRIRDVPDESAQSQNFYNRSSAGITEGKDRVNEVFGEVQIPLLRNQPFANELSVTASGRYTDYRSYGSDFTYRLGAQWAPIQEVRFRGNYGTAFRAPNLFEQYVADQSGFFGYDPCDSYRTAFDPSSTVYQNCDSELAGFLNFDTDEDGVDDDWVATGTPETFTKGGAGVLKAETAKTWGVGVILTAPREFADLSLAIDYFNIQVNDRVDLLNTSILDRCYESEEFRSSNFYCTLVSGREQVQGTLISFDNPYLNIAKQKTTGIDFSGRYGAEFLDGKFVANLRATRMLKSIYQSTEDTEPFDYVGWIGFQGTVGGPKWTGDLDLRFERGPWTFRYGVKYIGPMDGSEDAPPVFFAGEEVELDLHAGTYWEHGASVQWDWNEKAQVTFGVNNLFNVDPKVVSTHATSSAYDPVRIGNFFNYSGYDILGRTLFMNVTRKF
jgi:iron complex outermembrane receptor protein